MAKFGRSLALCLSFSWQIPQFEKWHTHSQLCLEENYINLNSKLYFFSCPLFNRVRNSLNSLFQCLGYRGFQYQGYIIIIIILSLYTRLSPLLTMQKENQASEISSFSHGIIAVHITWFLFSFFHSDVLLKMLSALDGK